MMYKTIHRINECFRFGNRWIPKTKEENEFAIKLLEENKIREATISYGPTKLIKSGFYINSKLDY